MVTTTSLSSGTVGVAYSAPLTASGGVGPYSNWMVSSGALPNGLTLSSTSGVISGTPTTATGSPFSFGITVKDSTGSTSAIQTLSITIVNPLAISNAPPPTGTVGVAYSAPLTASGGVPPYSSWTVSSGALPNGLTLSSVSGVISGTPTTTTGSPFSFSVTVKDTFGNTSPAQALSMTIVNPLAISTTTLPNGTMGSVYSAPLAATGGIPPYSNWTVSSGVLPDGLTLNSSSGVIGGTPTTVTPSPTPSFGVTVKDSAGNTSPVQTLSIRIVTGLSIVTTTLPNGTVGVVYSAPLAASGGVSPYSSWTVSSGVLPNGLTLNSSTGVIGGTPGAATGSPISFSVTVKDSAGSTSPAQTLSITIVNPLAITTTSLPNGTVSVVYSAPLAAGGGLAPYSNWTVSSGTLPTGLTLNSATGVLSGTPTTTTGSPFSFSITVKDTAGTTSPPQPLSLSIVNLLAISNTSPPTGTVAVIYSAPLTATGGVPPYSNWTVSSGVLPPGLTLNSSTGVIGGTPGTATGSPFSFSITVKDSAGNTSAAVTLSITIVNPLAISNTTLPNGTVSAVYSAPLTATGGVPPYSNWTVSGGTLPNGLTLSSSSAVISGTPTTVTGSPLSFSVTVKDSAGSTSPAQTLTIKIVNGLSIITTALPNGTVGVVYSAPLAASGGVPPYSNWTVSSGTLPTGLTLNSASGVIGGTPTTISSSPVSFSLTVKDSGGSISPAQTLSITIVSPLAITSTSLPNGAVGAAYSAPLTASGGVPPYSSWTVSSGTLPNGLTLNSTSGVIGGTPITTTGSPFSFSVTVKDSAGTSSPAQALSIAIVNAVAISNTTLPNGTVGAAYTASLTATGGVPPYSNWTVSSGALPIGLTLNSTSGVIIGTPATATGSPFSFSVTVKDSAGGTSAAQTLSLTIISGLSITSTSLPNGTAGVTYSAPLTATGGVPPYSNWTVSSGALPNGLTLNSTSGVISGTPAPVTGNPFVFSVTVKDSAGNISPAQALSIKINSGLSIISPILPIGTVGVAYSAPLTAGGGMPPYSWTVSSGALPNGLTLNSSTGVITGTPTTAAGSPFTFSITVKDSAGTTLPPQAFSITINAAVGTTLAITTASISNGIVGVPYQATLNAQGVPLRIRGRLPVCRTG